MLQQYRWQEHMVLEIKSNLKDFEADELFFTDVEFEEISWLEGRKEFVHDGKFYDVIEVKSVYGGKVIKCLNDHDESLLLQRFINSGKGEHNPFHTLVKGLLNNLVFDQSLENLPSAKLHCTEVNNAMFAYAFSIKESILSTPIKPPLFF